MNNFTIALLSLTCYLPDEKIDETYLMFNGKKIWPKDKKYKSMKEDSSARLEFETSILTGASIKIELWEYDVFSADDKLGIFILEAENEGGPYVSDMIKEDKGKSKYSLNWKIK